MKIAKSGSKKKKDNFKKHRKHHKQLLRTKIYKDAKEIKKLDKHVDEFLKEIKKDRKKHEPKDLKKHAKEFEKEVHKEIRDILKLTREDLKLYLNVVKKLHEFEAEIEDLSDEERKYIGLTDSEIRYAEVILKNARQSLDSLEKLFDSIRDRK